MVTRHQNIQLSKVLQIDKIEENFELFQLIYRLYGLEHPVVEPIYNSYPTTLKL